MTILGPNSVLSTGDTIVLMDRDNKRLARQIARMERLVDDGRSERALRDLWRRYYRWVHTLAYESEIGHIRNALKRLAIAFDNQASDLAVCYEHLRAEAKAYRDRHRSFVRQAVQSTVIYTRPSKDMRDGYQLRFESYRFLPVTQQVNLLRQEYANWYLVQ